MAPEKQTILWHLKNKQSYGTWRAPQPVPLSEPHVIDADKVTNEECSTPLCNNTDKAFQIKAACMHTARRSRGGVPSLCGALKRQTGRNCPGRQRHAVRGVLEATADQHACNRSLGCMVWQQPAMHAAMPRTALVRTGRVHVRAGPLAACMVIVMLAVVGLVAVRAMATPGR